jgi:UTP--glucose-1-phosphate uridylyltransferase
MRIQKAVVTAAGRGQRRIPLQEVVDRDGQTRSVLRVLCDDVAAAGCEHIAVVVRPGDEAAFEEAAGDVGVRMHFVQQDEPRGYGDALLRASDFVGDDPFLHVVGDHLFVARGGIGCARQLVEVARREGAAVSAVQATRENRIGRFGTVGGRLVPGRQRLYEVERVLEKPTPTVAEQELSVPGLRAGRYLCFFGLHVLTPAVLQQLRELGHGATLTDALASLLGRERYLAHEVAGVRHDLGERLGLFAAQLELGLAGVDRDEFLEVVLALLAERERGGHATPEAPR